VLPPEQALAEAQRLLDAGRPFQAHEVLEAVWKAAPAPERELWRGMTQVVVGVTHLARGNTVGAVALLRRGARNLEPYTSRPHRGVDVAGLADWALSLAAELELEKSSSDPAASDLRRHGHVAVRLWRGGEQ
jgi:predicted metal-dependent hydrolase